MKRRLVLWKYVMPALACCLLGCMGPGRRCFGNRCRPIRDAASSHDLAGSERSAPDASPGENVARPPDAAVSDGDSANPDLDPSCAQTGFEGGDVSADLHLTKACSPYDVRHRIVIKNGATLTVEPGVSLRFAHNLEMAVGQGSSGWLVAEGSAEDPITLTSASPTSGIWTGITLYGKAVAGSRLKHVRMESCGAPAGACIHGRADAREEAISIDHVTIDHVGADADGIREDGDSLALKIADTIFPAGAVAQGHYAIRLRASSVRGIGAGNVFNGAPIQIDGGTVSDAASWINPGTPIVITDVIYVDGPHAVLTLAPGTRLRFGASTGLWIGDSEAGQLLAVGTETQPIVFTSAAATPGRGDWDGLHFWSGTQQGSKLAYVQLDHCGSDGACVDAGFGLKPGCLAIDHVFFDHVGSSSSAIREVDSSRVPITNCTFAANAMGEGQYAISVTPASLAAVGSGNVWNGALIEVPGGKVTATTDWVDPGTAIAVTGEINLGSSSKPVLTIGAGMTLKFDEYCDLQVGLVGEGKLVVAGRADAHVTFTSLLSPPAKGNWYGILLLGNAEATLTYADVSYAGSGGGSIGTGAFVAEDHASLQMSHVTVKHNAGYGVVIGCDNPNVSIDEASCSFEDNTDGARGHGPTCHQFIPR